MRESCMYGSARGALSNGCPYRNRVLLFLALPLMLVSCQNPSRPLPLDALADLPSTCIIDG
jgi:hypothetical protein